MLNSLKPSGREIQSVNKQVYPIKLENILANFIKMFDMNLYTELQLGGGGGSILLLVPFDMNSAPLEVILPFMPLWSSKMENKFMFCTVHTRTRWPSFYSTSNKSRFKFYRGRKEHSHPCYMLCNMRLMF